MTLEYKKDFDQILSDILNDYSNLDSNPDVSQGSMPFIMGSVLASMIWGLYRYNDYNAKQMFVDTSDSENLRKHGAILDIPYLESDTDSTYLDKILSFLRQPSAGGNQLDFENWALDQENCFYTNEEILYYNKYAHVVSNAFGSGTVGIYTVPSDETIIDVTTPVNIEEELRSVSQIYINLVRPLGMLAASVVSAKPLLQSVTMIVYATTGGTVDTVAISDAIEEELNSMTPGEDLYMSTLICIALSYGAKNAVLTAPTTDISVIDSRFIRSDTITISEA